MNRYQTIIFTILGGILTSIIIYNRVIRVRLPKNLQFIIDDQINYGLMLITCISIIIFCILLLQFIRGIHDDIKPKSKFVLTIITRLQLMSEFMKKAFFAFYNYMLKLLPECSSWFEKISLYIYYNHRKFNLYIIIFIVIPKLMVAFLFLIEIYINFKFYYFYKCLVLLLIPVIFKLIIYILNDFACSNEARFKQHLNIEVFNQGTSDIYYIINFKNINDHLQYDLNLMIQKYRNFLSLKEFYIEFDSIKLKYDLWLNFVCNILYLLGWMSIIYINIVKYYI